MSNDDLSILAKSLKLDCIKVGTINAGIVLHDRKSGLIFNPKEYNDQFVEIFEWITKIGYFEHLTHEGAGYRLAQDEKIRFCSGYFGFKENIINIAIQCAKYLEEEEENDS